MLAPMRPRPTITSSKLISPSWTRLVRRGLLVLRWRSAGERLGQRLLERSAQLGQSRIRVVAQVYARDGQFVRLERDEIADGLSVDQRPKCLVPAGNLDVVRVVRSEREKAAGLWAALVELSCRVEEAWPEAHGHGTAASIAQHRRHVAQRGVTCLAWRDVCLEREVAVALPPRRSPPGPPDEPAVNTGQTQRRVAGQRQRAVGAERLFGRKVVFVLVLVQDALRVVLRLRHVRLVKRIDAEHGTGDGRGEFPAEELAAQGAVASEHAQVEHRMTGCGERLELGLRLLIPGGVGAGRDTDEYAVAAVRIGAAQRLGSDRQDADAVLAGALGDELLDPHPERRVARFDH